MEQEAKLDRFKKAVFTEIETKTEHLKVSGNQEKEAAIEKNRKLLEKKANKRIEAENRNSQNNINREIAKKRLDSHRTVLLKRNEITTEVFSSLKNRLKDFCSTAEYKKYILNSAKSFAKQYSFSKLEVRLLKRDMPLEAEIKKALGGNVTVTETTEIEIGGFIAIDAENSRYYNETLEQKLDEQHSYFIENSGLTI